MPPSMVVAAVVAAARQPLRNKARAVAMVVAHVVPRVLVVLRQGRVAVRRGHLARVAAVAGRAVAKARGRAKSVW